MMILCLLMFLLFEGVVVGAILGKAVVHHPTELTRPQDVELIVEKFAHLDHRQNETSVPTSLPTPDGDEVQVSTKKTTLSTRSPFAQLLLRYANSTESHISLKRDKGESKKLDKESPDKGSKGKSKELKGTKQAKSKVVKGEKKNNENKEAEKTASSPSISPSPSVWMHSSAPTERPSSLSGESKGTTDLYSSLDTVSPVDRLIPAFELSYTTSRPENPGIKEYEELVEVTRVFINETLRDHFESFDAVGYDGSKVDSYHVKGVHSIEYHIRSTWTVEAPKILPLSDLGIIVTRLFQGSILQSYLAKLHAELPSSNVFSSTTAVTLKQPRSETDGEDFGSVSTEDGHNGNNSVERSKTIVAVSIVAGGVLSCLVILAIYCRRRTQVDDIGDGTMKPDETECGTLDAYPMTLSEVSFRVQRKRAKDEITPDPFLQDATDEVDGHFSEIILNEI